MKTLADFLGKTNFILKADNPSLKGGTVGQWESYRAHEFPKLWIFVLSITRYTDNLVYVKYFNRAGNKEFNVSVPSNLKVKLINESIPQKIMDKYYMECMNLNIRRLPMTIGSDPEMFVEDEKGVVIPAFQFLGSKSNPSKTAMGAYGSKPLYWDGFQGEFETSVGTCLGWQTDSVQCGLKGLLIEARKFNPKAKISSKTVVEVPSEILQRAEEQHVQFGCMPSLNAYGMKGKLANGRDIPFRPAGGHIHFGINQYHNNAKGFKEEEYIKMVKALDAIIGVACVSLFADYDNPKRRELYGLAGEYRLPPHGLEYRTLSNAWLIHPMIMNLVVDVARVALTVGFKDLLKYWKTTEEETIKCINTCDVKLAQEILKRNKQMFFQVLRAAYEFDIKINKIIFDIFLKGVKHAVKKPDDIIGNWNLEGTWATHGHSANKNLFTGIKDMQSLFNLKKKAS